MPKLFAWIRVAFLQGYAWWHRVVSHVCSVGGTLFCSIYLNGYCAGIVDDCLGMNMCCCYVSVCGKMIHNSDIKIGNGQKWGTMY